jgi:hypothetical protein
MSVQCQVGKAAQARTRARLTAKAAEQGMTYEEYNADLSRRIHEDQMEIDAANFVDAARIAEARRQELEDAQRMQERIAAWHSKPVDNRSQEEKLEAWRRERAARGQPVLQF